MLSARNRQIALPLARRFSTASTSNPNISFFRRPTVLLGTGLVGGVLMQTYYGTADDFFSGKYRTNADPDALLEFYQAEELLKIFAFQQFLGPIFFKFVMDGITVEDHIPGPPGKWDARMKSLNLGMEVEFKLTEKEMVTEEGHKVLGSFVRHERFKNFIPYTPILLWDQTWDYGFKRMPDGSYECFHKGRRFYGPFFMRLAVWAHQTIVLYLCKKYVNSATFGEEEADDDE
ncbi:unnamed protein product [Vitrella brassicaformis CCMP3155]|uniref:Uncharacterized protein n=2 Tax=Vitrella brassicaformis TaxID=1169539 RepID=A0A0G4GJ63_VITBC|nr:unnamed protein product [Vitrella brassicaformis CCMP3155]|mmetsp:Transcript_12050/g.34936  ORF Transcript_12050/g.34936 Transcript_12050/m.34936 type:complete len:232 (+) Transcript_12050:206-901(+)|eukprot:CEM29872.1 unnamed protein product [Vitrella brassicaformis CCMP3155]